MLVADYDSQNLTVVISKMKFGIFSFSLMAAKFLSRRHTDDMIHKLESAGLGYHVKTDESEDRLGMYRLVVTRLSK